MHIVKCIVIVITTYLVNTRQWNLLAACRGHTRYGRSSSIAQDCVLWTSQPHTPYHHVLCWQRILNIKMMEVNVLRIRQQRRMNVCMKCGHSAYKNYSEMMHQKRVSPTRASSAMLSEPHQRCCLKLHLNAVQCCIKSERYSLYSASTQYNAVI